MGTCQGRILYGRQELAIIIDRPIIAMGGRKNGICKSGEIFRNGNLVRAVRIPSTLPPPPMTDLNNGSSFSYHWDDLSRPFPCSVREDLS